MPDARPPLASRRSNRSGQATRQTIVDSAVAMLREQGFAALTLKGVAASAGIAYGNLTYHFPTREHLVRAMIDRLADDHRERLAVALVERMDGGVASIESLAGWLLDDALARETVQTLPELWAMAGRMPDVANALTRLYDETARSLALAAGAEPTDPRARPLLDALHVLVMLAAGRTAVFGHRGPDGNAGTGLRSLMLRCVLPLLASAHPSLAASN